MSSQLLLSADSAASSQSASTPSSSSGIASFSSGFPSSPSDVSYGDQDDVEWCLKRPSCRRSKAKSGGRRVRRGQQGTAASSAVEKKGVKNAREKERVWNLRQKYEELLAVLGQSVDRGTGHFSKVRTLARAIRRIDDLMQSLDSAEGEPSTTSTNEPSPPFPFSQREDEAAASEREKSPGINLSCEERLEPAADPYSTVHSYSSSTSTNSLDFLPDLHSDISPVLSTTPYFSYSSPTEFPPVIGNSSCMFPYHGNSPGPSVGLSTSPPLLCSPELANRMSHPVVPPGTLSPLSMSPPHPQQHPYHNCGSDVWLTIGCNSIPES